MLREELERAGAPVVELPSGAGHDAAPLGAAGVEAGMLFVRSLNGGASHSPKELSSDEDIELALGVLTATLRSRVASNKLLLARLSAARGLSQRGFQHRRNK